MNLLNKDLKKHYQWKSAHTIAYHRLMKIANTNFYLKVFRIAICGVDVKITVKKTENGWDAIAVDVDKL